jgi:hypothetical protein
VRTTQKTRCVQLALAAGSLSLASVLVASVLVAQTPQWKPFDSSADRFHALFPSEPEVSKNSVQAGGITYELRSYAVEAGTTALYIGVCDYGPKGAAKDPDMLLSSAEKGAAEHLSARIISEKSVGLDSGHSDTGRVGASHSVEFEAESDKMHFTVRMYMAGGVLYQVMVASPCHHGRRDI